MTSCMLVVAMMPKELSNCELVLHSVFFKVCLNFLSNLLKSQKSQKRTLKSKKSKKSKK